MTKFFNKFKKLYFWPILPILEANIVECKQIHMGF